MAGWNYLRYFRLVMPISFPCHGQQTTRPDSVYLVSESLTGVFGFRRAIIAWQNTSAGEPGLYYQRYNSGVSERPTLVAAFGGERLTGTITFEHRGTVDGRSQVQVLWNGTLLEDVTTDSLVSGEGCFHHAAVYFLSDPTYVARYSRGITTLGFVESARLGPLTGQAYDDPRAGGSSASLGPRALDWDDWWAYMGYAIPGLEGMSRYIGVRRGLWAGYLFIGSHLRVANGWVWADGQTTVRPPPLMNDYLQLYVFGEKPGGSSLSAVTDRAHRTGVAWVDGTGRQVLFRRVERPADPATYGPARTVYRGEACSHPALAAYDDGAMTCWYMAGGVQHASVSADGGHTWTEIASMMGGSLRNVAVTQHHGLTLGVGVSGGNLYFVRSNDQGRTQDDLPGGGGARQLVGACAADCRPCITWYPDGEVAVWAEDASGGLVTYRNANSGYGAWERV